MCCLFGLLDYENRFTPRQRQTILHILAQECEQRGTDATGISYMSGGRMRVYKRPVAGRKMWFHLPADASMIMGHTRMTTQGDARKNYNNHPFTGRCGNTSFALAHNGVIWNDRQLRKEQHLPETKIETDSYIAVQLLEQEPTLNFTALATMAETVHGQFTFTVMDSQQNLYFIKGHNPMAIAKFKCGFYLYASTEEILQSTIFTLGLEAASYEEVPIHSGQILCIDRQGKQSMGTFSVDNLISYGFGGFGCDYYGDWGKYGHPWLTKTPLCDIITTANNMGYGLDVIAELMDNGYYEQDIEDLLYNPSLLEACLQEIRQEKQLQWLYR